MTYETTYFFIFCFLLLTKPYHPRRISFGVGFRCLIRCIWVLVPSRLSYLREVLRHSLYPRIKHMAQLNISIPGNIETWINEQVRSGHYTTASDYLCNLVQADQEARQRLDGLLLEGLNSGEPVTPDDHYWADKKRNLKGRLG